MRARVDDMQDFVCLINQKVSHSNNNIFNKAVVFSYSVIHNKAALTVVAVVVVVVWFIKGLF